MGGPFHSSSMCMCNTYPSPNDNSRACPTLAPPAPILKNVSKGPVKEAGFWMFPIVKCILTRVQRHVTVASPSDRTTAAGLLLPKGLLKGEIGGHKGAAKQHHEPTLDPHPARMGQQTASTAAAAAAAAEGWIGSVTLPKVLSWSTHFKVYIDVDKHT